MATVGIRELKNNLSRYIRQLKGTSVLTVTDRGRVVAELHGVEANARPSGVRHAQLIAAGVIRPAQRAGDPLKDWPTVAEVSLPRGTVAKLIAEDRGA